ncbi:sigma-54-dependent transcriptional regulator [Desulfovibrio psychrotolerans]|uniref:Fis family transcriptional regulator n=1 Tax=Desulfovibrio psychrotolerans TaxID=415242 RepID=A0A7J0BS86_9BACT|nr:sigma-54 dependent transcriptional regulator [Desulfovibrio psychrotolerans]GFM36567.1 Fis family transcriptional regulator [Desulfovibrio psychrotolerans]
MIRVLIVDDEEVICMMLTELVRSAGHEVRAVQTLAKGLDLARQEDFDLVYLDVALPDGNGLNALSHFMNMESNPEVIIITGASDPNGADLAIRSGAWDYIDKGQTPLEIRHSLRQALEYRDKKMNLLPAKRDRIVGSSSKLTQCIQFMAKAAKSSANVLIYGETGVGKDLFAHALHDNSSRANRPFVVVDCAALQESIAGSELYGHRKGSFSGATETVPGLVQQAHGGTLFLDEIGELDLQTQKKFLRVLENRTFRSLGGSHEQHSDFRLVCASNRDLMAMVANGLFREDLLFRVRAITLELPPLREHRQDLPELVDYFLVRICRGNRLPIKSLSPDLMQILREHSWPGNVRELSQVIESMVAAAPAEHVLTPRHLPTDMRALFARSKAAGYENVATFAPGHTAPGPWKAFHDKALTTAEKTYFSDLMRFCSGDFQQAKAISGLSQARLYSLLKKHGLRTKR